MNVINSSADEGVECPLCMEPLEVDDLNFYPCTCGYQICRFCWHRIRTDENELCPACRKAYPENPADFTPLSQEQISALKAEKRQRDQQRKQKITENRKHLANVRVVQKNLVFVVGLPPRLADADILKKYEYFGKYGKIHKVVINPSTTYAGVQGPSASAYVTYVNNNDALRAIQSVNNIMIDGRLIKTSLGTTKYCSHFMKNQQCPKSDCMYLHELGDSEASFTKEEMHQGKHQEYEKRLHDTLIAASVAGGNGTSVPGTVTPTNAIGNGNIINGGVGGTVQSKEAWPSLSTSPINNKEQPLLTKSSSNGKNGNNKENSGKKHHDKTKSSSDKKSQKNQKTNINKNDNHNKENNNGIANQNLKESITNSATTLDTSTTDKIQNNKTDKINHHTQKDKTNNHINSVLDDEINLIEDLEKATTLSEDNDNNGGKRSLSSSSSSSSSSSVSSSVSTSSNSSNNGDIGSLSDSTNGFPEHPSSHNHQPIADTHTTTSTTENLIDNTQTNGIIENGKDSINRLHQSQTNDTNNHIDTSACLSKLSLFDDNNSFFSSSSFQPLLKGKLDNDSRALMNNQLNSAISSHLPDLLNEIFSQKGIDAYQGQTNSITSSDGSLGISTSGSGNNSSIVDNPEKYLLSLNITEDWEAAFKYVMLRNNKQMEVDQQQQDELVRMQEMQKRNNLVNSIGIPSLNGLHDFNSTNDFGTSDLSRLSQQTAMFHQQQQQQQQQQRQQQNNMHHNDHMLGGGGGSSIFGTNMSKFFDFHKSQQQHNNHHHFMGNGVNNGLNNDHRGDHLSMATLLENNRVNSNYLDHSNGLPGQQLQKQRLLNKYDQLSGGTHNHMMLNNSNQPPQTTQQQPQPQQQQNRIPNQFTQNSTVDDELGFDPFIETQKALAELMENEMVQQPQPPNNHNKHILDNCQRTRMPPPGFNHMNAFGFGVPRAQGSKILPFMNMTNNPGGPNNGGIPPPPSNAQQPNNWTQHMNFQQPPPPPNPMNEQQMHMGGQQNNTGKSYGNMSDWTAMDPAILSFRQFPSFSSHQQQQPQQHQQQQQQQPHNAPDMFMQHLSQQNLPQSGQGFGHHGINLQNNILNPQNSQAQVNNYGHSNWLNNDQSLFMNNLGNGYSNNNNYDNNNKFSIPMPPGIHSNNMNCMSGNKQQKTECIN